MYSPSIDKLITALKKLPSVGEHTAERYVFYWLKAGKKPVTELMLALKNLINNVKSCETCWNFSDTNPCTICQNPKREHTTLCIVTESQDLMVIERSAEYSGDYFVLRGLVDPTDPESLNYTKIKELLARCRDPKEKIKEVILALNPTLVGDTTMMYLEKELKKCNPSLTITRLARGLPLGADLRYADEITLGSAIKNRTKK